MPHPVIEPLTVEQVNQFFASLKKYRDLAITQLMLLCGLRCREILSLKLENVSFEERKIKVMGKGRRERVLPLPDLVISTLQRYLRYERPKSSSLSVVFVILQGKRTGNPMTYDGIRSLFRNRRQDFQLRNANPHRWRHTFGANMARERVPLPLLQRMMGHHDPKVTLRYIYLSMADIADEYQRALKKIENRYEI
jgi:integrase